MNRRLPRFALLVVLLITMVGVFRGGAPTPTGVALAQEPVECGPWKPYESPVDPNAENTGYAVTREYQITEQTNSNLENRKALIDIMLFEGGELSIVDTESIIVAIDSGLVKLTVCGDNTEIGIQKAGADQPEIVGPGEYELEANSAVFVDPDEPYFLTGLSSGDSGQSLDVQQLDLELAANELPAAQPGSGINAATGIGRKLCGGAGC